MKKAAITSKYFLVEGGCNACAMKNTETVTIHFEDRKSEVLERLDVPSLVQTIAQKNGWREHEIQVGISEEEIVLKKEENIVHLKYIGNQIVYQIADQQFQTNKTFENNYELFGQVNKILGQIFKIEPYDIRIAEE